MALEAKVTQTDFRRRP